MISGNLRFKFVQGTIYRTFKGTQGLNLHIEYFHDSASMAKPIGLNLLGKSKLGTKYKHIFLTTEQLLSTYYQNVKKLENLVRNMITSTFWHRIMTAE